MTKKLYGTEAETLSLAKLYLSKGLKPEHAVPQLKKTSYLVKGRYFYGTSVATYMQCIVQLDSLAKSGHLSATKARGLVFK